MIGIVDYKACTWQNILERSKQIYGSSLHIQDVVISEIMGYKISLDGKKYLNTLRGEKNPSCQYKLGSDGLIRLIDYGNAEYSGMTFFNLLMKKSEGDVRPIRSFAECLKVINEKFNLGLGSNSTTEIVHKPAPFKPTKRLEQKADVRPDIKIKARNGFSRKALDYWAKFSIDPILFNTETMNEKVYEVTKYYYTSRNGTWVEVIPQSLCFAFHFEDTNHFKIYTPYPQENEIKWFSNCDEQDIFGEWDVDPDYTFIITKSWKDRVALKQMGFEVVAFQNEGCRPLTKGLVEDKDHNCVFLFDNDEAGKIAARKMVVHYRKPAIFIPDDLGVTDVGECIEQYGEIKTKKLIEDLLKT